MNARIVTGPEESAVRAAKPLRDDLVSLLAGKVLHYPDEARHFNSAHIRTRYAKRLRSKTDGSGGRYWWVE